jgi:hypothetical protein
MDVRRLKIHNTLIICVLLTFILVVGVCETGLVLWNWPPVQPGVGKSSVITVQVTSEV